MVEYLVNLLLKLFLILFNFSGIKVYKVKNVFGNFGVFVESSTGKL